MNYRDLRKVLTATFPLLKELLEDKQVNFILRPVDMRWYYDDVIPISCCGFNPFGLDIYYGLESHLQHFLNDSKDDLGGPIEAVTYEILFALHDYVHILAAQRCLRLYNFQQGESELTGSQLRTLFVTMMYSEAAAVACVDWWLIRDVDLSVKLGTACDFRGLTTHFSGELSASESILEGAFQPRKKGFLAWLAQGYLSGRFPASGKIIGSIDGCETWLGREISQGERQRLHARHWLAYLFNTGDLEHAMDITYQDVEISNVLAAEVYQLARSGLVGTYGKDWSAQPVRLPSPGPERWDFRFVNAATVDQKIATRCSPGSFGYLVAQAVSMCNRASFNYLTASEFDLLIIEPNRFWESPFASVLLAEDAGQLTPLTIFLPS